MALTGWSVQSRGPSAASWSSISTFTGPGHVIRAHGFFLISSGTASGYSGTPAADFVARSLAGNPKAMGLANANGHVRLVLPGGTTATAPTDALISDTLGYGAGATNRATGALGLLGALRGGQRRTKGERRLDLSHHGARGRRRAGRERR